MGVSRVIALGWFCDPSISLNTATMVHAMVTGPSESGDVGAIALAVVAPPLVPATGAAPAPTSNPLAGLSLLAKFPENAA
mmetsp:Transcript_45700/g.63508  ORF Transcript_45700/g.63508 Transcript_45700/m.63508 type:complete len:80 (+) Transcript_45700:516-755(+)